MQRPNCTTSTFILNAQTIFNEDILYKCINLTNSLTHILLWYISVTVFGAGGGAGKF